MHIHYAKHVLMYIYLSYKFVAYNSDILSFDKSAYYISDNLKVVIGTFKLLNF